MYMSLADKIRIFEKTLGFAFTDEEHEYAIYWIEEGREGVVNFDSQEFYDFVEILENYER